MHRLLELAALLQSVLGSRFFPEVPLSAFCYCGLMLYESSGMRVVGVLSGFASMLVKKQLTLSDIKF